MSDNPKRTGHYLQELKELVIKNVHESRFSTLIGTPIKSAQPSHIVVLALLTIGVYGIYNHHNENVERDNKAMEFMAKDVKPENFREADVIRLDEMLERYAWEKYHSTKKRKFFQTEKPVQVVLDWSGVKFNPEKACYTELKSSNPNSIIYSVILENKNKYSTLGYNINTTEATRSFSRYHVTKGFTNNSNTEVVITPLAEFVKYKIGLKNKFSLQSLTEQIEEHMQTWTIDEHVTLPTQSRTTISITVKGQHKEYDFETWVAITGNVNANFYNEKKKKVVSHAVPMQKFILENIHEDRKKTEDGIHKIQFSGLCSFKCGIQYETNVISDSKKISFFDFIKQILGI